MNAIRGFRGQYSFLSNFYASPLADGKLMYPTAEHMFQARKTTDVARRREIAAVESPAVARRLGRGVELRRNWEQVKFDVMQEVVMSKFCAWPELAGKLAGTGACWLVEGNAWHDQVWGDCACWEHANTPGRNALGIILMRVRLEVA